MELENNKTVPKTNTYVINSLFFLFFFCFCSNFPMKAEQDGVMRQIGSNMQRCKLLFRPFLPGWSLLLDKDSSLCLLSVGA